MVEPTRADIEDQVAHMESACMDIEDDARIWRNQTDDEDTRSLLYDVEKAAQKLCHLVGQLTPSLRKRSEGQSSILGERDKPWRATLLQAYLTPE